MIFKKIAAGAIASALAVSTMAMSASANIYPIPEDVRDPSLGTDGSWLIQLYNPKGNEAENKPPTDRGLDLQAINNFIFYVELLPYPDLDLGLPLEMYDVTIDGFGGNVIYSANGGTIGTATESDMYDEDNGITLFKKYNWPNGNTWWGFPEKDDSYEGRPTDQGGEGTNQGTADYSGAQRLVMEYVNTFAYRLELDLAKEYGESDPDYKWPEGGECYQVGLQEWGNDVTYGVKVDLMILKDIDGNFMMAFNEFGEEITEDAANEKIAWLETREVDLTAGPEADTLHTYDEPADDSDDSSKPADIDNSGAGPSGDTSGDSDSTTTTAPTTSNNSSSSSSTPIIIGIIIAVVVIVVIIVVVVVAKKKKS